MTKLSIIIVNWNTKELLRQCLNSLVLSIKYHVLRAEIIVVDNGSTDGSVEMVKETIIHNTRQKGGQAPYNIHLIENQSNLGFAKGNNVGIREAQGQYIMLLNSDTIIREGAIQGLMEAIDRYDTRQMTAASPSLLLPDGKFQNDYYMKFPNLWQIFLYHNPVLRPLMMKIPLLSSLVVQRPSRDSFVVDQLPGTALMAARAVWDKVGRLDEDYKFFFEDVDWCWQAKRAGIKLIVVPEAEIIHLGGGSWKKRIKENSSDFYYQFFSSMLLFVRKNYPRSRAIIFKWSIILNFFLTSKPLLAWQFFKGNGRQKNYLIQ